MDEADIVLIVQEKEEALRLKYANTNTLEAEATGFCLCCNEPLPPPRRWCDKACTDMWEEDKRRARR